MFVHLFLGLTWLGLAIEAQITSPSPVVYIENNVPTGKPIAGNYGGALRPQIHFSPPVNFMVSLLALSQYLLLLISFDTV